jgi:hypothetical protein
MNKNGLRDCEIRSESRFVLRHGVKPCFGFMPLLAPQHHKGGHVKVLSTVNASWHDNF